RAPVGVERDRLRGARVPARLCALWKPAPAERRYRGMGGWRGVRARPGPRHERARARLIKGALRMPVENDSPWLLDMHERGLQTPDGMASYPQHEPVDLVVVGAGAGGVTLAQRLARAGWRIVVLEKGPFGDPDRDWVSDEKGARPIYWTDNRIIGGSDPIEMGKNNSGVGVGGSMVHFAGYTPRFHPSDFEVQTRERGGDDCAISYDDLH